MDKKVVLITGASSGIGSSLVDIFLDNGWIVIATLRSPEKLKRAESDSLLIRRLDVTDEESMNIVINEVYKKFGAINILINNAGYGQFGVFENTSHQEIKNQFDVNLFGVMKLTKKVLPIMRNRKEGQIIFISSIVGKVGIPGAAPYVSSKFALEGFAESLQYELKQFNINLDLVLPGTVKTKFWENRKITKNNIDDYNEFQTRIENWNGGVVSTTSNEVAKRVFKLAKNKSSRLRHYVTVDSLFVSINKKMVPEKIIFKFIDKIFSKKKN